MIITDIRTAEVAIPLVTPFRTALRTVEEVRDVLVCVETDQGLQGFGEAPPTGVITGETLESITAAVQGWIRPALLGRDVMELEGIMKALHSCMVKNTSAKAAVDMAVYDLRAKALGVPLWKLLGGYRSQVETDLTVSVNAAGEMVRDSLSAVEQGFRILKIKVGRDSAGDLERLSAIRKAVGPEIRLRVDANQGWEPKEAVRIIRALEDGGVEPELVEQPVKAQDLAGMKLVRDSVLTPILADESVFSAGDAIRLIQLGAADLINIKLMKTGGIYGALQICAIAESCGVECMIGCMLESKLAVSAAAHLAGAKGVITRADLDGPSLCREDPYEGGPVFQGGQISLGDAPGLGFGPELLRTGAIFGKGNAQ
ncbi:MAG: dipeptide epimerase [Oscillospiraceae bacterium]|jgi:o-succinylbenzoate synthase|nr:dipeptide epimerase [Oscillospiraceae bacterium]